jgi:uncharacterized protein with HEPN domain
VRDHTIYLHDILTAIDAIEGFVGNMTFEEFCRDDKTVSAVIRKLEIIGEATKNIPDDIRKKHDHIPWREMAGMRDKLIHFYFGVNHNLVWKTLASRLPELKDEIRKILESLPGR